MSAISAHALTGPEKAAVLLLALGSTQSAKLLSNLAPRQAAVLSRQIARVRTLDAAVRDRVLEEFRDIVAHHRGRPLEGGDARLRFADDGIESFAAGGPTITPTAAGDERATARTEAGVGTGSVRPLDLSSLERAPRRAIAPPGGEAPRDIGALGDLPVRCSGRIADIRLSLSELETLQAGDVLLLGAASGDTVELVGGEDCRLEGRLHHRGRRRTIRLLGDAAEDAGDGEEAA
jgi:flagellar motor switch/type III secretory pathway protein FliN